MCGARQRLKAMEFCVLVLFACAQVTPLLARAEIQEFVLNDQTIDHDKLDAFGLGRLARRHPYGDELGE